MQSHIAVSRRCFLKKVLLEILENLQEDSCPRVSFLIKMQACLQLKKETLAQVFSYEFWQIPKNTVFTEHLWWLLLT